MICQCCGMNQATVHLTRIINNQKLEIHLCQECSKKKGKISLVIPGDNENFINSLIVNGNVRLNIEKNIICTECETTYNEFIKTGKLGCGNCYSVFRDTLMPLIKRLHGDIIHKGIIPEKDFIKENRINELEKLKKDLSLAVNEERYEEAAVFRDKIRDLEKSLNE
jgi:protein arginine kinase activator